MGLGYDLGSPGNQPIGPPYGKQRKVMSKCINHSRRNAIALWNLRLLEPVCLECLENCVKQAHKPCSKKG